jgi:plasmid stabilization system protein ParE
MLTPAWAPEGREDVRAVLVYLQERSPAAAGRLIDRLEAKIQILAQFPGLGQDHRRWHRGLRSVAVEGYVLFFRARGNSCNCSACCTPARTHGPCCMRPWGRRSNGRAPILVAWRL